MNRPHSSLKGSMAYNDLTIRIIAAILGAHIVTEYGSDEPWLSHLFERNYLIEFGSTLLVTSLTITMIYQATLFLDKRYDWYQQTTLRIILQALLGIIAPTIIVFSLAALYFWIRGANIFNYHYHIYALPYIIALISIFNCYYVIQYLIRHNNIIRAASGAQTPDLIDPILSPTQNAEAAPKSIFVVHTPTGSLPVPVESIAYFYRTSGKVFLRPFEGNDQILVQSLDQIESNLDKRNFFRVARHMIVNHKAVTKYYSLNYGKIGFTLKPNFKGEANVSKLQAKEFKLWFDR